MQDSSAVGFVLAGGRSTRMGTDKALIEFRGRPLITHALGILKAAGLSASIAGAQPALSTYAPLVPDRDPDHGPLGGVCAALASTPALWAVFVPVDLPLLPASLIAFSLSLADCARATPTPPPRSCSCWSPRFSRVPPALAETRVTGEKSHALHSP